MPDEDPTPTWSNWSGSITFEPAILYQPENEQELQRIVHEANESDHTVRVAGQGHSWTPLVKTPDILVSLENMTGLVDHDATHHEATILGGTTLQETTTDLHEEGLAMANLGDVTLQLVAGAMATGTHGTGPQFPNLGAFLKGGRIITGTGEIRTFHANTDPELLHAAQVNLGALGILTHLTLDLVPPYKLERREYCARFEDFWPHLDRLIDENRNFDFYWYPRRDEVKLRLLNPPGGGTDPSTLPFATLLTKQTQWWHQAIPAHNAIDRRFEEMEYAIPREKGHPCFETVRERVKNKWRAHVGWRLLVRTVKADQAYLSTEHETDVLTISLIQNAQLEHWPYFQDIESIFLAHDGRPHWGKKHTLRARDLEPRYPEWGTFKNIRRKLDPHGTFVTDYLADLLGLHEECP